MYRVFDQNGNYWLRTVSEQAANNMAQRMRLAGVRGVQVAPPALSSN
jgi:hypothetical protein